ncbi:AmmeMemoRadiSam system protein B [Polytolypa hystricis UAMH7299]|uniref:AmmeMemoRadiSam system protein B n=1 Tax=Polytolypa hystricis (strain UAMH7299) TaxID=1447883 RepID=A0A2B7Z2D4_POLH7|nr:AmmeMemoRadiSam system protein B [Polytolypa hystricis UAMH7299]
MPSREATHAGSWYSDDGPTLSHQLDRWLDQVPDEIEGVGKLPVSGARIIIAPHAGYAYSGPCAAYAYKSLDLSKAKRIFLIGPSHHHPLSTLALSQLTGYSTPLSSDPLPVDTELIAHLQTLSSTSRFTTMSRSVDEAEHSLELHLPYIHHLLRRQFPSSSTSAYPPLVPIMVGSTSAPTERAFGGILAPYLADPENAFIISSDFCHWGLRFAYTYYTPDAPAPAPELPLSFTALPQPSKELTPEIASNDVDALTAGTMLRSPNRVAKGPQVPTIHESISACDIGCMKAIASGDMQVFLDALRETGNTVCGRHPIGVIMAALEVVRGEAKGDDGGNAEGGQEGKLEKGKFYFLRYERSSDVVVVQDSSVSYVSAFAVL